MFKNLRNIIIGIILIISKDSLAFNSSSYLIANEAVKIFDLAEANNQYLDMKSLKTENYLNNQLLTVIHLSKISDDNLYAYNVYQIEGEGKNLFSKINGDKNTIMGLPIKKIKKYLNNIK